MTPLTSSQLRAEITRLTRMHDEWEMMGADCEQLAEVEGEIGDLQDMLSEMEPVRDKYAPTGGLNISFVCAAFGMTEEELDKEFSR
jgi:hypothetical protein